MTYDEQEYNKAVQKALKINMDEQRVIDKREELKKKNQKLLSIENALFGRSPHLKRTSDEELNTLAGMIKM